MWLLTSGEMDADAATSVKIGSVIVARLQPDDGAAAGALAGIRLAAKAACGLTP
ncbi:MAG: hypothetical protein M3Y22_16250 [Pseudomonadota bacterium]|nr:hypothetical protein [Pseudomonadota bacterium]